MLFEIFLKKINIIIKINLKKHVYLINNKIYSLINNTK
jgi:hypothetical protein